MVLVVVVNTAEGRKEAASVSFAAANTAGFEKLGVDTDVHRAGKRQIVVGLLGYWMRSAKVAE